MAKEYNLERGQELLFKVGSEPVSLELRHGLAEVHGSELLKNKRYKFTPNSKVGVFTYHGARIELTGNPFKLHVSKGSEHMLQYLKVHGLLETMRQQETSPICLVCEPPDARNVGKSTLCRILLNYATRRGRAPIFVDLDPDLCQVGLPGSVGAISIEAPIDVEAGFSLRSAMVMHFGHTSPSGDIEAGSSLIYKQVVASMAKFVHSKLEEDKKSFCSGVIINTPSWSDSSDYNLLLEAIKSFKANMILVMDDEVLQGDLQKDLSDCSHQLTVSNVPKTVEIHKTRPSENVELRYHKIKQYFYGTDMETYSPMTSEIKFSVLKRLIYKVGNQLLLTDSLMPLGTKTRTGQPQVTHFDCAAKELLHHILAISYCKIEELLQEPTCVLSSNIMGFIVVTSVKADGEVVGILTPQKLPNPMEHVLLYSSVQYMDSLL